MRSRRATGGYRGCGNRPAGVRVWSMEFNNARLLQDLIYNMRMAEWKRGINRALINGLANGGTPYSPEEERANNIEINVSDLSHTRLLHDARLQQYSAHNKPGQFFSARTDRGNIHKRQQYGVTVSRDINKRMKRSDPYYECQRCQTASTVLHGIAPALWSDCDRWRPKGVGIEDVLIPDDTNIDFDGLPFLAVFRSYTALDLIKLTRSSSQHKGWNMPVVNRALKWADDELAKHCGSSGGQEYWAPEKREERFKSSSGMYASSMVPRIDCWDFYYWGDEDGEEGWRRKIIFDAEGGSGAWNGPGGYGATKTMPSKNLLGEDKGMFLFDSENQVWGKSISEIIHFEFADLSAVSPFKYHSVRSLGWMLYGICQLQNRLNCKTWEAVMETLMCYMRVNSSDESQRSIKIQLANRGIVDQTIQFLGQNERWNPNSQLVELGHALGTRILNENSASWVQNQNHSRDKVEKTKFQVMAEINAMMTLVSSALQQSYRYRGQQYREIFRRFMKPDSTDPEVRDFRACVLAQGVPEKLLVAEAWDIEPERVSGSGNKTLEMAIAETLMQWRAAYSPEAQQTILRMNTLAVTDDAALADVLVPQAPRTSDTAHDTMVAFGTLMSGGVVKWKESHSRIEIAETLLAELSSSVTSSMKDGEATMEQVEGFENVIMHISEVIGEASKDEAMQERVKELADASGKLSNAVQMLRKQAESKKAEQNGNGGIDPKVMAQIEGDKIKAQRKDENAKEAHSLKTSQRQVSHEYGLEQKRQAHEQQMALESERANLDLQVTAQEKTLELEAKRASAELDLQAKKKAAEQTPRPSKATP